MLQGLQERRNRRIADGGQSGSRFLTNRFDLVLKQRNERLNRVCVPYPTQRLGRVHPDDPVAAAQCRDERSEHPLIRNGGQDGRR